jgi:transcription elongation factor Elf1
LTATLVARSLAYCFPSQKFSSRNFFEALARNDLREREVMPVDVRHAVALAECATCPECEKVLVLGLLAPEYKRPFVEGHMQGWVLTCTACGTDFPARVGEIFHTPVEMQRIH